MSDSIADAWLRLAHVGMHPDRLRSLISDSGSPREVLDAIGRGRVRVPEAARLAGAVGAAERREALASAETAFVLAGDASFPSRLAALPDSPFFLFRRGSDEVQTAVAVVGTRACTGYGRRLAHAYGRAISEAGWCVVSGLARGIDGAAHDGSLAGPTPGVAVLGSGVDVWYPRQNAELGRRILRAGGTVWSEAPPGTRPVGWRFPPRNRVISGLAHVVVVVEASERGGALITARTAAEQGRDVCATPGDIDRPSSVGCNLLIRDGAIPVHDPADLMAELELLVGPPPLAVVSAPRAFDGVVKPATDASAAETLALLGRLEIDGQSVQSEETHRGERSK